MAKLVNFRCPESLQNDIERIGLELYPVTESHHQSDKLYDVTATIKHILQVGIDNIDSHKSNQSQTNKVEKVELLTKLIDLVGSL